MNTSPASTHPHPRSSYPLPTKPRFMALAAPDVQPSPASSSRSEFPYLPKRRRVDSSLPEPRHPQNLGRHLAKQGYGEKLSPHPSSVGFDATDRFPSRDDKDVSLDQGKPSSAGAPQSLPPGLSAGDPDLPPGFVVPGKRTPVERSLVFDKRTPTQPRAHKLRHARPTADSQQGEREPRGILPPPSALLEKLASPAEQVLPTVKTEDTEEFLLGSQAPQTEVKQRSIDSPIKQELSDPWEIIIPERKLVTESCSFYPIPDDCRKSTPGYKENRVAFFQKEYKRLQGFGLRKRRVVFRFVLFLSYAL